MRRQIIEYAIAELERLLATDSDRERDYQDWFERHPIVFRVLGYRDVRPHVEIITEAGKRYIPDFVTQLHGGGWEIFEIKTPQASVLLDRERRRAFYATFQAYISQCHEYSDALDDTAVRRDVTARTGIEMETRPSVVIVAGRSNGLDQAQVRRLCSHLTPPVKHMTFDDIRLALEQYRIFAFSQFEETGGMALQMVVKLRKPPVSEASNSIVCFGSSPDRDCVSVFVDACGYLQLALVDSHGQPHVARSTLPLEEADYNQPLFLHCEVGTAANLSFLSVELGGKYLADVTLSEFPLTLSRRVAVGTDIARLGSSWMTVYSMMWFRRPLGFRGKAQAQYATMALVEDVINGSVDDGMIFSGHGYLESVREADADGYIG